MKTKIDYRSVREIIESSHSYYDKEGCQYERRSVLTPDITDLLRRAFSPEQKVLDIGCGHGRTLLEHSSLFKQGIGIDNSEEHITLANRNKEAKGVANVEFINCPSFALPFAEESFDFVFSERGPLSGASINIQAALRMLRPDGLIFTETLGSLNHKEADLVFHPEGFFSSYRQMNRQEEAKVFFERNGIDVRLVSSHIEKLRFPNIYEWVKYQCSLWGSEGWPSSPELEVNIEKFLKVAADDDGRISLTYHLIWLGGVKQSSPPQYWEYQHFKPTTG